MSTCAEIELNSSQLCEALDIVKLAKVEIDNQLIETKHLNDLTVGPELKMVEMKKQLDELQAQKIAWINVTDYNLCHKTSFTYTVYVT